jgi:hypothetical protein
VADTQIHPTGTLSTPADYVIPDSAELILKGARASYNGSGAATSFIPLLRIISDAGTTSLEFVADTTVAAGGSADVTWFPRVGAAAQAASLSSSIVRAYAFEFTGQTVTAGTTANARFDTVATSDATKLSFSTTTNTNDTLTTHGTGWLQLMASCYWPAGTKIDLRIHSSSGYELFPHDGFDSMSGYGVFDSSNLQANLMDIAWYDISAATNVYRVQLTNSDAGNSGPTQCYFAAMFYPGLSL